MAKRDRINPCDADCPVRKAMEVLDGKWTLLIIRELLGGKKRFGELLGTIGHVSPKVLTQRLKFLESKQIINKIVYPVIPPKVEYELTEIGHKLRPVIDSLAQWGNELDYEYVVNFD